MSIYLIHCSCPDEAKAKEIGRELVKRQLAACVSILPIVASIYQWEGEVQEESEVLMLIKSHQCKISELEELLMTLHPYETPEFLVTPVTHASSGYARWIDEVLNLNPKSSPSAPVKPHHQGEG